MNEKENFRLYSDDISNKNISGLSRMVFYRKDFPEEGYALNIRPLYLKRDIPVIQRWVNEPYAQKYWQMPWSKDLLFQHCDKFMESGNGYSLMVFIRSKPVAQINFYHVMSDEIKEYYNAQPDDYGIHALMGKYKKPLARLSTNVVITCLHYLFTLSIDRIIGAPDSSNKSANELARRVGFRLMKTVQMSYKEANLYSYTREDFLREHP